MKSIVMPQTVQLTEKTKTELVQEVKETLAIASALPQNDEERKFTATDMWNRNRNSRSASDMMRRWNLN
jgi:hypothetical protein